MASKLRHSKFRNVYASPNKSDKCIQNISFATGGSSDSTVCDVNGKFIAIIVESTGGGNFLVLKIDEFGRVDLKHPRVCAHTSGVTDLKWSPFGYQKIASSSEDASVKCFLIPENGLTEDQTESVGTCKAPKKVTSIVWHPTAEDIIGGICHDMAVYIWRINTGEEIYRIPHDNFVFSFDWNFNGSLIATTCKDKMIRCFSVDGLKLVWQAAGHKGTKASRVCFTGSFNSIITTGFSREQQREISLWVGEKPVTMALDTTSAVLFPFYDEVTHMLTVLGKGDTTIRFYEIFPDEPYIQFLTLAQSSEPFKGFGVLPKSDVDFMSCEISRIYKLMGKSNLQPNSVIVPRKSTGFQDDVFSAFLAKEAAIPSGEWNPGNNSLPRIQKYCPPGSNTEPSFIFDGEFYPFQSQKSESGKALVSKTDSKVVTGSFEGGVSKDTYDQLKKDHEAKCKEVDELRAVIGAQDKKIEDLKLEIDNLNK